MKPLGDGFVKLLVYARHGLQTNIPRWWQERLTGNFGFCMRDQVAEIRPGSEIPVVIMRDDKKITLHIAVQEYPATN